MKNRVKVLRFKTGFERHLVGVEHGAAYVIDYGSEIYLDGVLAQFSIQQVVDGAPGRYRIVGYAFNRDDAERMAAGINGVVK